MIDATHQAELISVGFDDRQMVDGVHLDGGREVLPGSLPRRTQAASGLSMASILP